MPNTAWQKLLREPRYEVRTAAQQRPKNVKQRIIRRREFEGLRLQSEDYADFEYRPTASRSVPPDRVRKNISHEKGETRLFDEIRYFFYITNDWAVDAEDVVFEANDRCDQENLIAQLAGGVRALSAPVDNLYSNWAYMVMTGLAWNLKSWWALSLPEDGRWGETHRRRNRKCCGWSSRRSSAPHQDSLQDRPHGPPADLPRTELSPTLAGVSRLCRTLRC